MPPTAPVAVALHRRWGSIPPLLGFTRSGRKIFPIAGGDGTEDERAGIPGAIATLEEARDARVAELQGVIDEAATRGAEALDGEDYQTRIGVVNGLNARIAELRDLQASQEASATAGRRATQIREPVTYSRHATRNEDGEWRSFFADVYAAQRSGDPEAAQRLRRHAQEQAEEIRRRNDAAERAWDALIERGELRLGERDAELVRSARFQAEARDLTRIDGAGGDFVPPLWLVDEYVALARAARPFADAMNNRPLPPGTDSINIPTITGGTATGVQTGDNVAVQETDMVTGSIAVPVRTIAGQQDIALQLLEQSPIAFDEVVFADLLADYNARLDAQLINGSGAAGQILGILQVSGINSVAYTDATPTVPELYPKVSDALNQAATGRKLPPDHIFMHARRWFWHTAALDTQNRPLVPPEGAGPMNALGRVDDVASEGPIGNLQGVDAYMDMNIPVNLGAGTNEDRIIASRMLDHWLWESFLRTRVLPEVLSGTLTVRLQLYNYVAATCARYPAATSVISGTGLITPTF